MRALLCLCLLPLVSLAQESQPASQPASVAQVAAQRPPEPEASGLSLCANVNLQGWTLLLAGAVGGELSGGLRFPRARPATSKRSAVAGFLSVEATAHIHKFGAISSDSLTFAGVDLSARLGSEARRGGRSRAFGRSLRVGGGVEQVSVFSQEGSVPPALSFYGVASGDLYVVATSSLRVGIGATVYAGTPTEEQTGAKFVNLFPLLDLLKLSLVF